MTENSYKAPETKVIEVYVRDILLYSGVRNMLDYEVFSEELDNDIY